jgi:lysophospholipase L1-like esterase
MTEANRDVFLQELTKRGLRDENADGSLGEVVTAKVDPVSGRLRNFAGEEEVGAFTLIEADTTLQVAGAGVNRTAWLSDPALKAYRLKKIAAGGSLSHSAAESLRAPLQYLMCSTVTDKLRVLSLFDGDDLTSALVPFIGPNMTGQNLVAGDYSQIKGITGNAANKWINTNFNPTASGVTGAAWGMGAFQLSVSQDGVIAGAVADGDTYLNFTGANVSNINGRSSSLHKRGAGFTAVQVVGGQTKTYTGDALNSVTANDSTTPPNSNLTLLQTASNFYSSASLGGFAAWSGGLTDEEVKTLSIFFKWANNALGRLGSQASLLAVGDSNTEGGIGPVTTSNRWSKLLADSLGLVEDNQSLIGSSMSDDEGGAASHRWVSEHECVLDRAMLRNPGVMVVMLGTNDAQFSVSSENFNADYRSWLSKQLAAGVRPEQIILCTPIAATNAGTNQARLLEFVAIVKQIAADVKCGLFDAFTLTQGVPAYWQGDNLHLSVAGQLALKNGLNAYIRNCERPEPITTLPKFK